MSSIAVRHAVSHDMLAVCAIVNHYIGATTYNFRSSAQVPDEWQEDLREYHERYPWLVAVRADRVVGIAYATPWKARAAYNWSAEVTVYIAQDCTGSGIGRLLYGRLLNMLDLQGYHTQIAVIALPNDASVALHQAFGFTHAGTLREVGYKQDSWRDVGFWQRRSASTGPPATSILPVTAVEK